ncbi:MAG: hypothetical protein M1281_07535 [Chloroflexi bacterium]|nr:hypothetical protein [Chloroflexota bacterium]
MKRLRSPRTDPRALLVWQDHAGLDLQKESLITALSMTNDVLRLLVAALCFAAALRGWNAPPPWVDPAISLIYYGSIGLALPICCFLAGASITFWIASHAIQPVISTLADEGITRGQLLIRWEQISHYQADPAGKNILIYSRKCPQYVTMVCRFLNQEIFAQGRDLLAARLSPALLHGSYPWYRRKAIFAILLSLIMWPFFILGLIIYPINEPWVWFYYAAVIVLSYYFNIAILRAYIG